MKTPEVPGEASQVGAKSDDRFRAKVRVKLKPPPPLSHHPRSTKLVRSLGEVCARRFRLLSGSGAVLGPTQLRLCTPFIWEAGKAEEREKFSRNTAVEILGNAR